MAPGSVTSEAPATPMEGAISDGRHLLATYRRGRKKMQLTTSTPRSSTTPAAAAPVTRTPTRSLDDDEPREDLDNLCEMARRISLQIRKAAEPNDGASEPRLEGGAAAVIVELTRALTKATTMRDADRARLETENRQLRSRVAHLEKQLDELAFSFDALMLCLGEEPVNVVPREPHPKIRPTTERTSISSFSAASSASDHPNTPPTPLVDDDDA